MFSPPSRCGSMFGRNAVRRPMAGRNAHTRIDQLDAEGVGHPAARSAAPIPATPNASPKNSPEIMPADSDDADR